jgi:hypothetical protein
MTRHVGASFAIVAFAAGAVSSAGADTLSNTFQRPGVAAAAQVESVVAAAPEVEVVTETEEVTLDHDKIEKSDPYEMRGVTRIVSKGEPGTALITYDVTYVDGIEISRVENISIVVSEPTDEVISVGTLSIPATTPAQQGSNRALGKQMAADLYGWSGDQWACLDNLWKRESGWRHTAQNGSSGAYGIPQAYPGTKMASAGDDWRTNPATQIKWGLGYVDNRYGTPCKAWSFFLNNNSY